VIVARWLARRWEVPLWGQTVCPKNELRGISGVQRPSEVFLERLRRAHPNLDYHLDLIADMGAAQWFEKMM
jgi:hypothetical protein